MVTRQRDIKRDTRVDVVNGPEYHHTERKRRDQANVLNYSLKLQGVGTVDSLLVAESQTSSTHEQTQAEVLSASRAGRQNN